MKIKDLCTLCVVMLVFSVFYCKEKEVMDVIGVTDATIKIGGIFCLTGPAVATIRPWADAHRNYARHINDQGGIHGRKIRIIAYGSLNFLSTLYSIKGTLETKQGSITHLLQKLTIKFFNKRFLNVPVLLKD